MNFLIKNEKIYEFLDEFIDSNLVEKGNSENTVSAYKADLNQFIYWLKKKNFSLKTITEDNLENYLIFLSKRGYKSSSISRKTACLKAFFKFLLKENYRKSNLMKNINRRNNTKLLPKSIPNNEINLIFRNLNKIRKNKLRNIAIFEILYGCGLRVSELINLDLENINFEELEIKCTGKGNKQIILPTN